MWMLILIAVLYLANFLFFRWIGGVGSASDALAQWGRSTAEKRRRRLQS